jgi:chromodomain-helicase-DNA-binding protein 7
MQNHIQELWAILHFLHPNKFDSKSNFLSQYGNLKDADQVSSLHTLLRPYMLRRMKHDVEQSIPFKLEKIIEVDLTSVQKTYYRAILEKNRDFLQRGTRKSNAPSLNNILMELRKCCNHCFLINGAESRLLSEAKEKYADTKRPSTNELRNQLLISGSSKVVLLDKLLKKLREGGHRVLIFSQMVMLLDILEDFLVYRNYPFERMDGGVSRNHRQSAIDRFSDKSNDHFVFLLSTRAGGLGLNLTAADTVIIFDSDWNPQNDLQAQVLDFWIFGFLDFWIFGFLDLF